MRTAVEGNTFSGAQPHAGAEGDNSLLTLLMILAVASSGCEVVEGIFKAGMWGGVIMVAVILVVVFWIVGKMRRS